MKKILLLTLISTLAINTHAQTSVKDIKNTVAAVTDSTKSLIKSAATSVGEGLEFVDTSTVSNKLYSDVKGIIISVAKGLGVAVERVYTVLTIHYVVRGITELIIIICVIWILIWGTRKINSNCIGTDVEPIPYVVSAMVVIGGIIFLYNLLPDTIGMIFNAEYYTINDILQRLAK